MTPFIVCLQEKPSLIGYIKMAGLSDTFGFRLDLIGVSVGVNE